MNGDQIEGDGMVEVQDDLDYDAVNEFIFLLIEDSMKNVIEDVVSNIYANEKKLRTRSAAVQAEVAIMQANGASVLSANPAFSKQMSMVTAPLQGQCSTATVNWENGKASLIKDVNPLQSLKENYCPRCRLPRLMFPLAGIGSRIPDNVNRQYCTLHPFIQMQGHDIYGNPFPIDAAVSKKEREAIKKREREQKDNTPGSADTGTGVADGDKNSAIKKLLIGGKCRTYIPWHTCPHCTRSRLISSFARHLEGCLGIGGRPARITATARLSSHNVGGSINGSQSGSRNGTPTPSSGKRDAEDHDDDGPPKKKVRKIREQKKEKEEKVPKVLLKLKNNLGKSSLANSSKPGDENSDNFLRREASVTTNDDTPKKKTKFKESLLEMTAAVG